MAKKKTPPYREEQLIALLRKQAQRYLEAPGVTSVGVGRRVKGGKKTNELCIQFTVERKLKPEQLRAESMAELPKSFTDEDGNEVPVDILERRYEPGLKLVAPPQLEELSADQQRRRRQNPIQPGISVSHPEETAGTLGAIVYDETTGEPYILSNWHVLHGPKGKLNDRVLQPGPFDGGDLAKSVVGRLVRSHLGLAGDCAVASIKDRAVETRVIELNVTPKRIAKAELDDKVIKSGRTTGVTRGIVDRVGVVVNLNYGGTVGVQQIGGFEIVPDPAHPAARGEVSEGGDSGSCWLSADPAHSDVVVGLHFAGESDSAPEAEHALACNIHSVVEKLKITFDPETVSESACAIARRHIALVEQPGVIDEAAEDDTLLTPARLDELEKAFARDPEYVLAKFRAAIDADLSLREVEYALEQARLVMDQPQAALAPLELEAALEAVTRLPEEFTFPGMDLEKIPINPGTRKFETYGDLLGWSLIAGGSILAGHTKSPFREASQFASRFEYPLPEPGARQPLEIALFSDFGTGLYHSRYIAQQLVNGRFPCAIHLGDVYYAGRKSEFKDYVRDPLAPLFTATELYMLNSNHEMYSGAKWYFRFLDDKRQMHPAAQRQEGSYFCLRSSRFQILGIDTAYHEDGRFREQALLTWLDRKLSEGVANGQTSILLSANHPYEYGEDKRTDLFARDLRNILGDRVALWFWGNTHYCALYDRGGETPFVGSCIGHAGYPYGTKRVGKDVPAPLCFLETAPRFPAWTKLRQGRGNNGYCVLTLNHDGSAGLRYIDWMTNERCTADLQTAPGGRLTVANVRPRPFA
jgi:hypothetical protein